MRLCRIFSLALLSLLVVASVEGQSPNGTISGIVVDPSGAAIVGADILVVNDATGVQYPTKTNAEGMYVVSEFIAHAQFVVSLELAPMAGSADTLKVFPAVWITGI